MIEKLRRNFKEENDFLRAECLETAPRDGDQSAEIRHMKHQIEEMEAANITLRQDHSNVEEMCRQYLEDQSNEMNRVKEETWQEAEKYYGSQDSTILPTQQYKDSDQFSFRPDRPDSNNSIPSLLLMRGCRPRFFFWSRIASFFDGM